MAKPSNNLLDAPVLFYLTKEERKELNKKAQKKYNSERATARYIRSLVLKDIGLTEK